MKNVVKMVVGLVVVIGLAIVGYMNTRDMRKDVVYDINKLAEEIIDRCEELNEGNKVTKEKVDNEMDIMELREYIREFWNIK